MKFKKTALPTGKAFISECGEYKVVNHGGKIYLYKKIDRIHTRGQQKGKKYRAFGDSVERDLMGNSKSYNTYRQAMSVAKKIKELIEVTK